MQDSKNWIRLNGALKQRRLGRWLIEQCGFTVDGPDALQISARTLEAVLPLFQRFDAKGRQGWIHAPDSLRLTARQVKDIPTDIMRWAVETGIVAVTLQNGQPLSYRLTENWQVWALAQIGNELPVMRLVDWDLLEQAIQKHPSIGLRTAAHLAFGNSHALDNVVLPSQYTIWTQVDAVVNGCNIVRAAGKLRLQSSKRENVTLGDRWHRPGHFIWEHDFVDTPTRISTGQRLILIENPYPYWELLCRWRGQSVTLVCIHGETLQMPGENFAGALNSFLKWIYQTAPQLETLIWCDPDPAGLVIANNAHRLVSQMGGQPRFWMMEQDVLARLESLVLAEQKLQPLTDQDRALLKRDLHPDLIPLAAEIERRGLKGEQEALIVRMETTG